MKQYTILHTIESGGPGGAETLVLNLATRLDQKRFRSLVLLPPGPWLNRKLKEFGIPTFEVNWHTWYDLRGPIAMAKIIRGEKVDLIHSHLPGQNFYSCIAGCLTRRPTLVTYHGAVELKDANSFKGSLKLRFVRQFAHGVIVVCDHVGTMLREIGFPPAKLIRVYNGIDISRFAATKLTRLHSQLGLSNSVRLVAMVANIRQSKGYDFFVKAARKVTDRLPNTRFLAVGDLDPVIAARMMRLVDELSMKDKFLFLGFREDIPDILSEIDVFVLSSTSEGLPLVLLEAMAASKPMVITRCGGPQEVVEDGKTGLLVPPSDEVTLADKICQLLVDESQAARFGTNAYQKVTREFAIETMISNYERLYETYLQR